MVAENDAVHGVGYGPIHRVSADTFEYSMFSESDRARLIIFSTAFCVIHSVGYGPVFYCLLSTVMFRDSALTESLLILLSTAGSVFLTELG